MPPYNLNPMIWIYRTITGRTSLMHCSMHVLRLHQDPAIYYPMSLTHVNYQGTQSEAWDRPPAVPQTIQADLMSVGAT